MRSLITAVLVIIFLVQSANAIGFGIAPSFVDLKDLTRGQSVEKVVTIYNSQGEELTLYPNAENFNEWVKVLDASGKTLETITAPPNGSTSVVLRISVPETAANGKYEIPVYFETKPPEGTAGIGVKAPVVVALEVVGEQRISAKVVSFEVGDTEVGVPAKFRVSVMNDGNVVAEPVFSVKVLKDEKTVFETSTSGELMPQEIKELTLSWDTSNADRGEYVALLEVTLNGKKIYSKSVPFNVFEKGTLTASLYVLNASLTKNVVAGKPAKFEILVKNTGYIDYEAKLRVEVYKGDEFVDIIQSDPVWIEKSKSEPLTVYLKFESEGEYLLKPTILYAGKIATLSDVVVKVGKSEPKESEKAPGFGAALGLLTLLVTVLLARRYR